MRPSLPVLLSVLPCATLLVVPALPSVEEAALPLAFQGQLVTAADGAPVDDELTMGFRVYDGEAAGASVIWEAADLPVEVAGGLFIAYLDVDADLELQAALVTGTSLWLGVTIGQGPELAGRIPLAGSLGTVLAQQSQSLVGCGPTQDGVLLGGECLQLVTEAALTAALAAHADDPAAHHARFTAPEAVAAVNAAADHWTAAHHVALATIATSGLATDLVGELADGTLPEDVVRSGDLAPVATSGQLADLAGTADALARVATLEQELAAMRAALTQQAVASPLAFPPDGSKLHLYVATSGDDGNDGLTPQTPRRTLQAAWRLLPRWVPSSGVVIHLKKGQYRGGILLADRTVEEGGFIEVVGSDDTWEPASRDQVESSATSPSPRATTGSRCRTPARSPSRTSPSRAAARTACSSTATHGWTCWTSALTTTIPVQA